MKSRNLFLGIIILFVGVVALLASLDVIDFSWHVAYKLWPLLLIFLGVVILPVKEWLRAVLLIVLLGVGVLLYQNEAKDYAQRHPSSWVSSVKHWWDVFDHDLFDFD